MFCKAGKTLKIAHNNRKKQRENRWRSENFNSELGQHKRTAGQAYRSITTEKFSLFKWNTETSSEVIVWGFMEQTNRFFDCQIICLNYPDHQNRKGFLVCEEDI